MYMLRQWVDNQQANAASLAPEDAAARGPLYVPLCDHSTQECLTQLFTAEQIHTHAHGKGWMDRHQGWTDKRLLEELHSAEIQRSLLARPLFSLKAQRGEYEEYGPIPQERQVTILTGPMAEKVQPLVEVQVAPEGDDMKSIRVIRVDLFESPEILDAHLRMMWLRTLVTDGSRKEARK